MRPALLGALALSWILLGVPAAAEAHTLRQGKALRLTAKLAEERAAGLKAPAPSVYVTPYCDRRSRHRVVCSYQVDCHAEAQASELLVVVTVRVRLRRDGSVRYRERVALVHNPVWSDLPDGTG